MKKLKEIQNQELDVFGYSRNCGVSVPNVIALPYDIRVKGRNHAVERFVKKIIILIVNLFFYHYT